MSNEPNLTHFVHKANSGTGTNSHKPIPQMLYNYSMPIGQMPAIKRFTLKELMGMNGKDYEYGGYQLHFGDCYFQVTFSSIFPWNHLADDPKHDSECGKAR